MISGSWFTTNEHSLYLRSSNLTTPVATPTAAYLLFLISPVQSYLAVGPLLKCIRLSVLDLVSYLCGSRSSKFTNRIVEVYYFLPHGSAKWRQCYIDTQYNLYAMFVSVAERWANADIDIQQAVTYINIK